MDEVIISLGGQTSHFLEPRAEGILGIIVCLILSGLGLLMLYSGKKIFKGIKFLFNISIAKIKEIGQRKKLKTQSGA